MEHNPSFQDILIKTAVVAGWQPLGKAQIGYLHNCIRRTIICNKLVDNSNDNAINLDHQFHQDKPGDIITPIDGNYRGLQQQVLNK